VSAKHLVRWGKPEPVRVGKSQVPLGDEFIYRSKCGRFTIRKRVYSLPIASVGYTLTVDGVQRRVTHDLLDEAKFEADTVIDPNWEG
jgi:hypothetical protein